MPAKIALVGHCGPDSHMLQSTATRAVPDAEVVRINSHEELKSAFPELSLLLVNRVLDGSFPHETGIDLIGEISKTPDAPPAILISNFPEAQRAARQAGAAPGFGKSELYSDTTLQRIREAMGISSSTG
ncbi:MAG TPA: hypothetical protein ENJ06_05780 [Phycisphaeraceae bacterium]|nr:hypothetical protein [Phycisphaeraceae bacterium]